MYQIYNKNIALKTRRHRDILENIEDFINDIVGKVKTGILLQDKTTKKIHELYLNNNRIFTIERTDLTGLILNDIEIDNGDI